MAAKNLAKLGHRGSFGVHMGGYFFSIRNQTELVRHPTLASKTAKNVRETGKTGENGGTQGEKGGKPRGKRGKIVQGKIRGLGTMHQEVGIPWCVLPIVEL